MPSIVQHYPFVTHTTFASFWKDLALWLTNVHPTLTGPGWTLVECDDTVNRDTPSGGATMTHIPASNAWSPSNGGLPPDGSWIVFQSQAGLIPPNNAFQLFFFVDSATNSNIRLFALANFVTGGGSTGGATPTLPAEIMTYNFFDKDEFSSPKFFAVADQSCLQLGWLFPPSEESRYVYVGEADVPARIGGVHTDPYPWVLRRFDRGAFVTAGGDDSIWARRNPRDPSIQLGSTTSVARDVYPFLHEGTRIFSRGSTPGTQYEGAIVPHPIGVYFEGSMGMTMFLRHVWTCSNEYHKFFLTHNRSHLVLSSNRTGPSIVIKWDETTGLGS